MVRPFRAVLVGRPKSEPCYACLDPAELHRVFPLGTTVERATTVAMKQDATGLERPNTATETLRAEVDHLRQVGEMLRSLA